MNADVTLNEINPGQQAVVRVINRRFCGLFFRCKTPYNLLYVVFKIICAMLNHTIYCVIILFYRLICRCTVP